MLKKKKHLKASLQRTVRAKAKKDLTVTISPDLIKYKIVHHIHSHLRLPLFIMAYTRRLSLDEVHFHILEA